jgi:Zn-dependent peptidase ImmA (M78 family)
MWDVKKVRHALGDKLIGKSFMREQVCRALLFLPSEMIGNVCKSVWFISSPEDAWAFTFKGADIKNRHLVFLSEELFLEDEAQIRYTILHEIGHVVLDHKNSIGIVQTDSEIKKQEQEADRFAQKYSNNS